MGPHEAVEEAVGGFATEVETSGLPPPVMSCAGGAGDGPVEAGAVTAETSVRGDPGVEGVEVRFVPLVVPSITNSTDHRLGLVVRRRRVSAAHYSIYQSILFPDH